MYINLRKKKIMKNNFEIEVVKRYSQLAEDTCCLSCGGALNFSDAKEGEYCLDIGCGRGNDILTLAQIVGKNGKAYGIDITPEMIEKAKRTANKLNISNVEFIHSTIELLPFENNFFDLIISNCTINHMTDKQQLWNEIYRILKPGGRFVISDIYAYEPIDEIYSSNPELVAECWAGAVTKDVYMSQIKNAGFNEVEILEESLPYEKGKAVVCSFTIRGYKK